MKIRTFSELREAAKDKAAKTQTTTKDKESDFFGTSRAKGEQDFRDAHGMDVQIKANKLKDNDHFSPNLKPATHRADGEKQPVRQGSSSQPGPTKLFQVKEEEQIYENKITHIVAKKDLPKHEHWMDSEGYDTKTKTLPKEHPKHKTHVGIVSGNSVESGYHEDGMAVPIKEEDVTEGKYHDPKSQSIKSKPTPGVRYTARPDEDGVHYPDYGNTNKPPRKRRVKDNDGFKTTDTRYRVDPKTKKLIPLHRISIENESVNLDVAEDIEQIEMNEDVFSSLKALASSNKSGNLKFKNGETGLVNSQSAGKIVDAYNKLSPENAKQMKSKMNSDVVGFMKVLHFVDKSAKAV